MRYDKLVGDKIPDKIIKNWETPIFHIAWDEEYYEKLKDKIREEIDEVAEAGSHELLEELADLKEVALAILEFWKIDISEIKVNSWNETLIEADELKMEIKIKVWNILGFIDIICSMNQINAEDLEKVRLEKLEKRWWFKKRIILEETL